MAKAATVQEGRPVVPEDGVLHLVNDIPYVRTMCGETLESVGEAWTDDVLEVASYPDRHHACPRCVAVARDEVERFAEEDARLARQEIAREEGMLCGIGAYNDWMGY